MTRASVGIGRVTPQGKLRITAPASFGRMHIIPALAGFIEQYPDLTTTLLLSDSIIDMVGGGFDIAIHDASLNDSTLIARKVAHDKRLIYASPNYLAKHGAPTTPQDLKNHTCVNLHGLTRWPFITQQGTQNIKTNNDVLRPTTVKLCAMLACYYPNDELGAGMRIKITKRRAGANFRRPPTCIRHRCFE